MIISSYTKKPSKEEKMKLKKVFAKMDLEHQKCEEETEQGEKENEKTEKFIKKLEKSASQKNVTKGRERKSKEERQVEGMIRARHQQGV